MSILTDVFAQARALLDLPAGADRAALKLAYRKKVIECPPDRDPDGFRRVRESYEILINPLLAAKRRLYHSMPHLIPPTPPEHPEPSEPLQLTLLRQIVAGLPADRIDLHLASVKPRKPAST